LRMAAPYSGSWKRASTSARIAASAWAASGPRVATSMRLPCSAASIMTPMMLRPFTTCPTLATVTSALKRLAVCTRSAAARAWSPRRLRISRVARCSSVAAPIGIFAARDGGARRRGRPEDVLPPVAQDEARQAAGVHLAAHGAELDEDRHVDPGHHLGARLARDREAQVGRRVTQHVGEDDRTVPAIDPAHRARDALADEHAVATLREPAAQLVDEHDRAMAAARAAERDGEVALPLALVERQGEGEEVEHAAEELLALLAAQHPVGDRRVGPGPGP